MFAFFVIKGSDYPFVLRVGGEVRKSDLFVIYKEVGVFTFANSTVAKTVGIGIAIPLEVGGNCGSAAMTKIGGYSVVGISERNSIARRGDIGNGKRVIAGAIGKIGVRIGGGRKLGTIAVGGKESRLQIARGLVVVAIGAENPDFVEIVCSIPVGIAVETGVDTINDDTFTREGGLEIFRIVAVFYHIKLVGGGAGEPECHGARCAVGNRRKGIGAGGGDEGDAVEPVAIFPFHISGGVLWRLGVGSHQIPDTNRAYVGAAVVVIEIGSTQ